MLIAAAQRYRPSWVKRIERASRYLNYRGVDAIAYVTYPDGREGPLLIQVKSKEQWRQKYFDTDHPWAKEHKVLCLVIAPMVDLYRDLISPFVGGFSFLWSGVQFAPSRKLPHDPASRFRLLAEHRSGAHFVVTSRFCSSAKSLATPARRPASAGHGCASHSAENPAQAGLFCRLCAHMDSNHGPSP